MGQHQEEKHSNYEGIRRRKEKEESIFEEIMAKDVPNLGKETDI